MAGRSCSSCLKRGITLFCRAAHVQRVHSPLIHATLLKRPERPQSRLVGWEGLENIGKGDYQLLLRSSPRASAGRTEAAQLPKFRNTCQVSLLDAMQGICREHLAAHRLV